DFTRIWERVISKYENGEVIEGRCVRRIKGGIVIDLMGIDAFLPGSQIDVKPIRDFDAFIGQTLEFKIVKVNDLRKNIVVSRRVLIEGDQEEKRRKILKVIEKNIVLVGTVKNITDFGVFIDLGGVDGLLHITDLSWGRVSHPSEIVSLDQKVKVMILDFDDNKERISLGFKQLTPHPWEKIDEKYQVGIRVKGKAVSITDYGVFIELEKGIEGLVHISEMSWTQQIKHPSQFISVGDELEVVILNIDKEEKKISLGLKQIEPDPWLAIEEKYPVDSRHKGKVRNITNFGVFVELEEGVNGLIHISDLSWTKKILHPSEVVKKGDEIEITILNVSKKDRRISLGHKQIEDNPWDRFQEIYKKGNETKGKVLRTIEKGLIVELPDKVDGFVPYSQLTQLDKKPKDRKYEVGEEFSLIVIEFDKSQKKIVLSYDNFTSSKEKQDVDDYLKKQEEGQKSTIGDIMKDDVEESVEKAAEEEPETQAVESEIKPEVKKDTEKEAEDKAESKEETVEVKTEEEAEKTEVTEEEKEEDKEKDKADEKAVVEEAAEKTEVIEEEQAAEETAETEEKTIEEVPTEEKEEKAEEKEEDKEEAKVDEKAVVEEAAEKTEVI
ncbi:30S ribosomal protein S1, partial [bacterium]|nr:30S ribosomal protein S1 [bacterium]